MPEYPVDPPLACWWRIKWSLFLYLDSGLNISWKVTQSSLGFDCDFFKNKFFYHCVTAASDSFLASLEFPSWYAAIFFYLALKCMGIVEILYLLPPTKDMCINHILSFLMVFIFYQLCSLFIFLNQLLVILNQFHFCIYISTFSFIISIFGSFLKKFLETQFASFLFASISFFFAFLFPFGVHTLSLSFALAAAQLFWCFSCVLVVF